jgi:hypothetical protein
VATIKTNHIDKIYFIPSLLDLIVNHAYSLRVPRVP